MYNDYGRLLNSTQRKTKRLQWIVISLLNEFTEDDGMVLTSRSPHHFQCAVLNPRHLVIYAVSQKNCAKLFLSEVRQISTKFDNFWHTDSAKDRFVWVHSFSTSTN